MKIYLAKSNKCSPVDYMRVRNALISKDVEILEHSGGNYDRTKIAKAEKLVVLPEKVGMPTLLGRGIYEQILECDDSYIVTNAASLLVARINKSKLSIVNPTDWTAFAQYDDREIPRISISSILPMNYDIIL